MEVLERREIELAEDQKTAKAEAQRRHEVDAQIITALDRPASERTPVEVLLGASNGLMGPGSCTPIHADPVLEEQWIRNRYNELKRRLDEGREFEDLDQEICSRVNAGERKGDPHLDSVSAIKIRAVKTIRGEIDGGPFPRARAHKDLSEIRFKEAGVEAGFLEELTVEREQELHEERLTETLEQINEERTALGLPPLQFVEA